MKLFIEKLGFSNTEEEIKDTLKLFIEEEIRKTIDPIRNEDSETVEFNLEFLRDYIECEVMFLWWFSNNMCPDKVLYAGSGFDIFPKLIFGEDKVFHTSLEQYRGDTKNYFSELGSGMKIVADNVELPFQVSVFNAVLFFGLPEDSIREQLPDSIRTLKNGGFLVFDSTILNEIDLSLELSWFEKIEVPQDFQGDGASETRFLVYRVNR